MPAKKIVLTVHRVDVDCPLYAYGWSIFACARLQVPRLWRHDPLLPNNLPLHGPLLCRVQTQAVIPLHWTSTGWEPWYPLGGAMTPPPVTSGTLFDYDGVLACGLVSAKGEGADVSAVLTQHNAWLRNDVYYLTVRRDYEPSIVHTPTIFGLGPLRNHVREVLLDEIRLQSLWNEAVVVEFAGWHARDFRKTWRAELKYNCVPGGRNVTISPPPPRASRCPPSKVGRCLPPIQPLEGD
jgi:hypothetical protein